MATPEPRRGPHPAIFLVLLTPFGVSSGYVGVTLAYLLAAHGVSTLAIAAVAAAGLWPQTWKVFWAPAVDTTLSSRAWYVLGAAGVGASIIAMSVLPARASDLAVLSLLVAIS